MPSKIELPSPTTYQVRQCEIFTEYVITSSQSVYQKRGSSSVDKIKLDIYQGKIAECMVYNYLEGRNDKPTPVDFTIYSTNKKSFDSDLSLDSKHIHVKSCLNESKYPNSWLFQMYDPVVNSPKEEDILALCVLSSDITPYCYVVRASEAVYEEPIAFPLKRTKVAIYEESLSTKK